MRQSLIIVLLCIGSVLSQNACEKKRLTDAKAGGGWHGTNLGSWFVLEHWMASYLWKDNNCDGDKYQGQYLFEQCVGGDKAPAILEKHWSTWITEDDFASLSKTGVNVVRLPVGWWNIYDPDGGSGKAKLNYNITARNYSAGGLAHIDKAFDWGLKHGIGILLDMHGTPGSQNGYDNSSPGSVGQKEWGKHPENVNQTIESLEKYAERYGTKEALVGFDLINEPSSQATSLEVLQDFYKRAYTAVRKHSDAWVLIMPLQEGDSGQNDHWAKFMNKDQNYTKVGMDIHMYSCFGGASDQKTMDGVTNYVKNDIKNWIAQYIKVNPKPMLVGEWSACQHADQTKFGDFFKTEWDVFGTANLGQTFWSYSDQGIPADQPSGYCDKDAWSMKTAIKNGWVGNLTTAC